MKVISTEQVKFPAPHADECTKVLAGDFPLQNIMGEVVRSFSKKSRSVSPR
jgi:hypothetical protein